MFAAELKKEKIQTPPVCGKYYIKKQKNILFAFFVSSSRICWKTAEMLYFIHVFLQNVGMLVRLSVVYFVVYIRVSLNLTQIKNIRCNLNL